MTKTSTRGRALEAGCVLVAVAVAVAGCGADRAGPDHGVVDFEVRRGETSRTLAPRLYEAGLIESESAFRWTVWRRGGLKLKAGRFAVPTPISPSDLATLLETPPPADEEPFAVVEGARRADVDQALAEAGRARAGAYLEATAHGGGYRAPFPLPEDSLEGYLYPETYRFPRGEVDARALAQRQLDAFVERAYRPRAEEIARGRRTLQQLVVMASLLEREELDPANRPVLAGILWKRFDRGLPLGVDATSRYKLSTWSDRAAFLKALRDPSDPYNTRLRRGLPPTAIGAVTAASFEASLHPAKTDALYYLHDARKKLHTARDGEEHERNRRKFGVY